MHAGGRTRNAGLRGRRAEAPHVEVLAAARERLHLEQRRRHALGIGTKFRDAFRERCNRRRAAAGRPCPRGAPCCSIAIRSCATVGERSTNMSVVSSFVSHTGWKTCCASRLYIFTCTGPGFAGAGKRNDSWKVRCWACASVGRHPLAEDRRVTACLQQLAVGVAHFETIERRIGRRRWRVTGARATAAAPVATDRPRKYPRPCRRCERGRDDMSPCGASAARPAARQPARATRPRAMRFIDGSRARRAGVEAVDFAAVTAVRPRLSPCVSRETGACASCLRAAPARAARVPAGPLRPAAAGS